MFSEYNEHDFLTSIKIYFELQINSVWFETWSTIEKKSIERQDYKLKAFN